MFRCFLSAALTIAALISLPASLVSPRHARPLFYDLSAPQQLATAYTPSQIEAAYNFKPLTDQGLAGAGQTIALIEVDSYKSADVRQFDTAYGLPVPVIRTGRVGGSFRLGTGGETTMDIEWAHALAPAATLQVYYLKNDTSAQTGWKALAHAVQEATTRGAGTISMSLGTCAVSRDYTVAKKALAAVMLRGVSVFVSSGDDGAHPGPRRDCGSALGVAYPGDDPSVVSVGGTSLSLNADNSISAEVAWTRSGGGRGRPFLRPAWQLASQLPTDRFRWAPDVAFLGDPATGVAVYFNGRWTQAGGTSLGAPAWAAIWSLVREDTQTTQGVVGAAPTYIYRIGNSASYPQAFHDITRGSNGRYQALPGWDAVTGWGTPDVGGLATAVQSLPVARR